MKNQEMQKKSRIPGIKISNFEKILNVGFQSRDSKNPESRELGIQIFKIAKNSSIPETKKLAPRFSKSSISGMQNFYTEIIFKVFNSILCTKSKKSIPGILYKS